MFPYQKDTYLEYRVKRIPTGRDMFIRVMLVLLILLLYLLSQMLSPLMQSFAFISYMIVTFGVVYAWRFHKRLYIEYEYIFTNGDLDIDKIMGKDKRERRYSIDCKKIEFFEPFEPARHTAMRFDRIAYPCSSPKGKDLYCIAFQDRTYGHCLVVIDINEEMTALKEAIEGARPRYPHMH